MQNPIMMQLPFTTVYTKNQLKKMRKAAALQKSNQPILENRLEMDWEFIEREDYKD